MVCDVAEERQRALLYVGELARRERLQDLTERRGQTAQARQDALQAKDDLKRPLHGAAYNPVFEIVHDLVERIEQGEIAVHESVEQGIEQEVCAAREQPPIMIATVAQSSDDLDRRYVDCDQKVCAEEHTELPRLRVLYVRIPCWLLKARRRQL